MAYDINALGEQDDREQAIEDPPLATAPDITATGGAPAWVRAGLSTKTGDKGKLGFLQWKYGPENVAPVIDEDGVGIKSFRYNDGKEWREVDPSPSGVMSLIKDMPGDVADFTGEAIEAVPELLGKTAGGVLGFLGGAALTAPAGGAGALPGTLAGQAALGALGGAFGSAVKQGVGAMLPGDEDLSAAERLGEAGISAAGGAIAPGVVKYGAKVLKTAAKPLQMFSPERRLKSAIAEGLGKESLMVPGKTTQEFFDSSRDLQESISKEIGEKFRFSFGGASGDKAALLAERTLAQLPETMEKVARENATRLRGLARFADSITKFIAKDPDKLGQEEIGGRVAEGVDRYVRGLTEARSKAARPLFEAAERITQGNRVIPADNMRAAIGELMESESLSGSKVLGQLRGSMDGIESAISDGGKLKIGQFQNLLARWGRVAAGKETVIDNLSVANNMRVGRKMLQAINADLDAIPEKSIPGGGVQALQQARKVWAQHTEEITGTATKALERILRANVREGGEQAFKKLNALSPTQLKGVMKILDAGDKETAQLVRGQFWKNVTDQGGMGKGVTITGEIKPGSTFTPGSLEKAIEKNHDKLIAVLGKGAMQRINLLELALARLSTGPGIAGSDTVPKALMVSLAAAGRKAGGPVGQFLQNRLDDMGKVLTQKPEKMAELTSTADGFDIFSDLVIAAANPSKTTKAAKATARKAANLITRILVLQSRDTGEMTRAQVKEQMRQARTQALRGR